MAKNNHMHEGCSPNNTNQRSGWQSTLLRPEGVLAWGTLLLVAVFYFTPSSVFQTIDYVLFYEPHIRFLRDAVFDGRLPLWNPYIGLGRPFLADVQPAVLYPGTYLVVFGGAVGLFIFLWLHTLVGAAGMFAFCRALGVGSAFSCLLGFAFASAPALTGRPFTGQIVHTAGLCYVPLLFLLAKKMSDEWTWCVGAGFSLALAAQFLTGQPQVFWCSVVALGVFILFRTPNILTVGRFLLVCVWCTGLVAVALLPLYELIGQGNRSANAGVMASFGALRWIDFTILVANPSNDANWEKNFYLGLPAALIGVAGLIFVHDKNIRGLWAVVLISMLISLGPNSPFFNLFCDWLPGYATLRLHSRMAFMISFALLVSGGMYVTKMQPRLLLLAQTNFNFPKPVLFAAIAFVLLAPMWFEDFRMKRYSLARMLSVSPEFPYQWKVVEALRREKLLAPGQPPPLISVHPALFPVNFAMVHHVATFDAYTALFLKGPWEYLHRTGNLPAPGAVNTCLSPRAYKGPFPYRELPIVLGYDAAELRLVRNPHPPSRAFLTSSNGTVRFLRYDCNSMVLETISDSPTALVLREAWYPGWHARIGSATQAGFPTNGWMRAFQIPPGAHQVHIYFRQNYLGLGAGVSFISLALCLSVQLPFSRAKFWRGAGTG